MMDTLIARKRTLRREVRTRIAALDPNTRRDEANWIFAQLEALPVYQQARTVLSFWSMDDEVPTHQANDAMLRTKRVVLPVVRGDDLCLLQYAGPQCLQRVPPFGIEEPQGTPVVDDAAIDLVIVPGVAFDRQMGRMGRGKGFYDRLFARLPHALAVGICFACQVVPEVPMAPHDRRVDVLLASQT